MHTAQVSSEPIVIRGLTKRYHSHLGLKRPPSLRNLNLTIRENEVFGFLGQNGAGKTTTIKLICSLLRPTAGECFLFGEPVRTRRARRFIGYLPENPYFYEYLTPKETLDFYGRMQGLSRKARQEEWEKLSTLLDLKDIANERVRGFSKGMRQRLGFAVALVGDPPILVLDEPMSGLDPLGRRRIRELIHQLQQEKKTIFFSSHVLGDVEQICNRVGILVKGELVVEGRLDELLGKHIARVEITAAELPADTADALAGMALWVRRSDQGLHYAFDTLEKANSAVRKIAEGPGILREFTPVQESLEEYFIRYQDERKREEVS